MTGRPDSPSASRPRSTPPALKVLAVPVVVAIVVFGVWFAGAVVSDDMTVAMVGTTIWFAIVGLGALIVVRGRRDLLLPVLGTFVVTATAIGGWLAYESLVDDEVNETVVRGIPASQAGAAVPEGDGAGAAGNVQLASGSFSGLSHPASGTAAVVDVAGGGRVLTLTDFETDPGPDLRVYLATDADASEFEDLGGLKGNVGNQQYEVPEGLDLAQLDTVVIWCRAFSVGFGQAQLAES